MEAGATKAKEAGTELPTEVFRAKMPESPDVIVGAPAPAVARIVVPVPDKVRPVGAEVIVPTTQRDGVVALMAPGALAELAAVFIAVEQIPLGIGSLGAVDLVIGVGGAAC
jgi:hypothetical protein